MAVTTGSQAAELRYKAYGVTRYTWGTTPTTYRYTGQREESTIGLYYYNARWYDPALGRFIQPDTVVPSPGNPQSLSRYSYGLNNPVRYNDPTGHWTEEELAKFLGKNWEALYFGSGAVFENENALKEFLSSEQQRNLVNLYWVQKLFERASVDARVLKLTKPDAIGFRVSLGGALLPPLVIGVGVGLDIILNIKAGQLSYFGSLGGGFSFGGGVIGGIGQTWMWNLPSNSAYRGRSESVGASFAVPVGAGFEYSQVHPDETLFVGDPLFFLRSKNLLGLSLFAGVGAGGKGIYDMAMVSYEIYRAQSDGSHWLWTMEVDMDPSKSPNGD